MTETYVDSTGETRDKTSGRNTNPPADTPAEAQADPSSAGASALKPQSALAQPDQTEIGKYEAGIATAQKPFLDKLDKTLSNPQERTAQFEKIKDAPNPQDYHKYSMEFASAAAVLGAVAGRWTRQGGTASLNAFAGALKGWQAGNLQAYEEASKQWEQNTKKTIENNNMELEKYHEILNNRKSNIEEMTQGLTIAGSEFQNSVITDLAKSGNFNGVAQAVDKMGQANQRLQGAFGQLSGVRKDQTAEMTAQIDELNKSPELAQRVMQESPKEWLKIKAAGDALQHPLNDPASGTTPLAKMAPAPRSAPAFALQEFVRDFKAKNGGREPSPQEITDFAAHYGSEISSTRTFASGTQGNAIRSFSVALDHLDVAHQLGVALQNGDSQSLNMLRNAAKQQFGWEGAVDFNFAKKIVGDEITKSILGSGAGTGQDREDIQKAFSAANSPAQLEGVITTAKRLMAGQLRGLKQQYEQTTHQTDFDQRLSPAAQRELGGLSPGAAAGGTAGKTSTGVEYTIRP